MTRWGAPRRRVEIQPILKNTLMAALSAGLVALSLACYLSIKGVFSGGNEFNSLYSGMYLWELIFTSPDYFAASFALDPQWAFAELVPLFIFTFALAGTLMFVLFAIFGRYNKTVGVVWGALICAFSLALLFMPYINISMVEKFAEAETHMSVSEYFVSIADPQYTTIFIAPVVGVVQLALSCVFLYDFGRKRRKISEEGD